jgi:hypothetical protein
MKEKTKIRQGGGNKSIRIKRPRLSTTPTQLSRSNKLWSPISLSPWNTDTACLLKGGAYEIVHTEMNENETTFVAPEGVYSVTEEYKPAPAHLHPVNNAAPAHSTKLSTITVRFSATKQGSAPGFAQLLGGNRETKREKGQDGNSLSSSDTPEDSFPSPEITGQDNVPANEVPSLFSPATPVGKKKAVSRPKHNIRTTSSTFISRLQSAEGLAKAMQAKQGDVTFLFYNSAKSFLWVEVGSKSKEPLARVTFTAYPTCHDVNPATASSDRLDVVIGFNTGDLVWFGEGDVMYLEIILIILQTPCHLVTVASINKAAYQTRHVPPYAGSRHQRLYSSFRMQTAPS